MPAVSINSSIEINRVVDNLFSLSIRQTKHSTIISMNLFSDIVNTSFLPLTLPLLKEHLPSILLAECFNDDEIPFAIEVKRTEIGHLFEHILLEYLCKMKLASGCQNATFSGRTYWNWKRDPKGTFHIVIKAGYMDCAYFKEAIEQTILLTKLILISSTLTFTLPEMSIAHNQISVDAS